VLDARQRPGINDILAMPLMRARMTKFLSKTLQVHGLDYLMSNYLH